MQECLLCPEPKLNRELLRNNRRSLCILPTFRWPNGAVQLARDYRRALCCVILSKAHFVKPRQNSLDDPREARGQEKIRSGSVSESRLEELQLCFLLCSWCISGKSTLNPKQRFTSSLSRDRELSQRGAVCMRASRTCRESSSFPPRACESDGTKKENGFLRSVELFPQCRELRDPRRHLLGVRGPAKFPYLFCSGCVSKVGNQ